ncbi:MAG: energy transducer TonB [Spirosoma sp.]|nr:energy transducer TonB [Spirosoma sp.]
MKWLFMLLVTSPLLAQNPVYKPFDVDQVARPQGGDKAISDYLKVSMRKPVTAQVDGIAGRVVVAAVVEPDGRVTDVRVLKGLRADADSEAVRVFSTFNAWRPALKAGQAVRQEVPFPVVIDSTEMLVYQNGTRTSYLDKNDLSVADTLRARYKLVTPVQPDWLPTGDIVRYKRKGSVWLENTRYVLSREELPQKTTTGKRITRLSYRTPTGALFDNAYEVDEDGTMLSLVAYDQKGRPYESNRFTDNGVLTERIWHARLTLIGATTQVPEHFADVSVQTAWFPSGQIRHIKSDEAPAQIEYINAVWDVNGHQIVKDGRGMAVLKVGYEPEADTAKAVEFIETGQVTKGIRQGVWTGRPASSAYFPDQPFFYEERYKDGILEIGVSVLGSDTAVYTVVSQQPQCVGGEPAFQRFLDEQLPGRSTRKKGTRSCCVEVSFTVLPDGTLHNYAISKPVQPDVDQHALRIVQATDGRWKPGTRRGRPVPMRFFVSIPANRL